MNTHYYKIVFNFIFRVESRNESVAWSYNICFYLHKVHQTAEVDSIEEAVSTLTEVGFVSDTVCIII